MELYRNRIKVGTSTFTNNLRKSDRSGLKAWNRQHENQIGSCRKEMVNCYGTDISGRR